MEMTSNRTIAVGATIAVGLFALWLPGVMTRRSYSSMSRITPEAQVASRMRRHVAMLNSRRRLLARHDSLARSLPAGPPVGQVLLRAEGVPPNVRTRLDQIVADLGQRIGRTPGRPASLLYVLPGIERDTLPLCAPGYCMVRQYILPSLNAGTACVSIFTPRANWERRIALGRDAADDILGPCSFFSTFGDPGPTVEAWLRSRNYDAARVIAWAPGGAAQAGTVVPRRIDRGQSRLQADWADLTEVPGVLRACASGARHRCNDAILDTTAVAPNERWQDGYVVDERRWFVESSLGRWHGSYLSDLIVEFGRDRFTRFWTSSAPLDEAFSRAFGVSMSEWTMRWAQYRYGIQRRGPIIPTRSVLYSLTLVLLIAALGVLLTEYRQVR